MARSQFGGSLSAFVASVQDASAQYGAGAQVLRLAPSTVVTFWPAQTGGTQYTDLLLADGTTAAVNVTTNTVGEIDVFSGPDGVTSMWAAGASGNRRLINANGGAVGPAGPAGGAGPAGAPGPAGPGEPPVYRVGGAYGNRPDTSATGQLVLWSGAVAPALNGTLSGGTPAMANGDIYRKTALDPA